MLSFASVMLPVELSSMVPGRFVPEIITPPPVTSNMMLRADTLLKTKVELVSVSPLENIPNLTLIQLESAASAHQSAS
jgi:hypothetical protein